jgi:hypothetical protein
VANTTDAFALASAFFEDCKTVRDFMRDKVRPVIERFAENNLAPVTVKGEFLRALGWLGTFEKLNHPSDFQAIISGTRALFEICVDLALMHHDRANLPAETMFAWEESAKLNAAERTLRCYQGRRLPDEHTERVAVIAREGARIRTVRARLWPARKGRHPERWTGRRLPDDAEAADAFGPYGFRDFYDGRFAELCWGTHGSGLAGVRYIDFDHFPGIAAFAFQDAARFGTTASELVLRYFDRFDSIFEARFRELERERKKWRAVAFAKGKGYLQGP